VDLAVEPVCSQPFSASNSREQGKIQGKSGVSRRLAGVRSSGMPIPCQFLRAPCIAPFVENRELTGNRLNTHRGRGATRGLLNLLSSTCQILSHNVHDSHYGSYNLRGLVSPLRLGRQCPW
jgi:hypothetical protein